MEAFGLTWSEAKELRGWERHAMNEILRDREMQRKSRANR